MNKILLALLVCTATAHAGDYSSAVATQQLCEGYGKTSQQAYKIKAAGVPLALFETHVYGKGFPKLLEEISIDGYNAVDGQSAYMSAWAKCMDAN